MKRTLFLALLATALMGSVVPAPAQAADGAKHPIFLMCPHKKKYSAWSVYVTADPSNPAKLSGLGLDKLKGENSEDNAGGYDGVLKAQQDGSGTVESLGTLSAAEFGKGKIEIEKDDALKLSIEPAGDDYRLIISMRCTSDKRFDVGGKNVKNREILVKFDKDSKKWYAHATKINSIGGQAIIEAPGAPITGINFPVTGTGIYRIVGVLKNGEQVLFIDGWRAD
jgi:hypothetical protein